jgi:hypothetical protein
VAGGSSLASNDQEHNVTRRLLPALGLAAAAFLFMPTPSPAQPYPGQPYPGQPYPGQPYPGRPNPGSYNNEGYQHRRNELSGRVTGFEPYNLWIDRNIHVVLHHGTVINPTGIRLRHGMNVLVYGRWNRDGTFEADQIDVVRHYRY